MYLHKYIGSFLFKCGEMMNVFRPYSSPFRFSTRKEGELTPPINLCVYNEK